MSSAAEPRPVAPVVGTAGPNRSRSSELGVLVGAAAVAAGLGILTAFAQGWLPDGVRSIANSSGPWALVAFNLALLAVRRRTAALIGLVALLALLGGYVLGARIGGSPSSSSLIIFWSAAGLIAGPCLGSAAFSVRARDRWGPMGLGVVTGVLVGEGAYGLLVVADTTSPPFWIAEIVLGSLGFVILSRWRFASARALAAAAGTMVATAAAFVLIYRLDLISLV